MEPAIPDLLADPPRLRLDPRKTGEALTFGFAQGIADDTWDELLAEAILPASTWRAQDFARELFLPELVASIRTVTIGGVRHLLGRRWLESLLSQPPAEDASASRRRSVLALLLADPKALADLESVYAAIRDLRARFAISPARGVDVLRRRLEILAAVRAAFERLGGAFDGAPEPLASLRHWARSVIEGAPFRSLVELLEYDDHLAFVDVRVRVGADGRVRGLVLSRIDESRTGRFARSPLGRWIARLGLLFRGYRFDAEELLAHAIEEVFAGVQEALTVLVQIGGDLELYLAAFALRAQAEQAGLAVSLPTIETSPGPRRFEGLFNPLLLGRERRVVPCDLVAEESGRVILVTGPNSGGKTRLLQAVGLAQLLGQCGIFVPAAAATLRRTDGIFVSFGQIPAADASEGRLGTELLRVRALFETICTGGLVLVDELCSGTNPSEGEELFRHVVDLLSELEPQAFLSTHFLTAAADLERTTAGERLSFLQVELDPNGLPTYQFVPGVAKTSLAHQTAARLGVTRDDLAALVLRAKRARTSRA
jgi:DNA mismatch repair protein MutS2